MSVGRAFWMRARAGSGGGDSFGMFSMRNCSGSGTGSIASWQGIDAPLNLKLHSVDSCGDFTCTGRDEIEEDVVGLATPPEESGTCWTLEN